MKLSEQRRELLIQNRNRVIAFNKEARCETNNCRYKYDNNYICAASAGLYDEERDKVAKNDNGSSFVALQGVLPDISKEDVLVLDTLQKSHDKVMTSSYCPSLLPTFQELYEKVCDGEDITINPASNTMYTYHNIKSQS